MCTSSKAPEGGDTVHLVNYLSFSSSLVGGGKEGVRAKGIERGMGVVSKEGAMANKIA